MRTDPTDSGGLFVGRRPGTAPVRYRSVPIEMGEHRRRLDALLANAMFLGMLVLCLLCWGPIPMAALWLGSRADYLSGNVEAGIVATFGSAGLLLFGCLSVLQRLDRARPERPQPVSARVRSLPSESAGIDRRARGPRVRRAPAYSRSV
jgi:hypothetical protein